MASQPLAAKIPRSANRPSPWTAIAVAIAAAVLLPLLVIFSGYLTPEAEIWSHIQQYVLPHVLKNTLWLALGVGTLSVVIGTSLAWLTAVCEFPGRRFFDWALLLPMAVPGYVIGFVMIGLLEYAGPVQSMLRNLFGPDVWFPSIRSRGGVILVMSLVLYPYVYLLARNAFMTQGLRLIETARVLGYRPASGFIHVALPMARPWIFGGLMLVLMETLADFGTVAAFNYDTFTTAIYEAWFSLFSIEAALQLSSVLVLPVLLILLLHQSFGRGQRFYAVGHVPSTKTRISLRGVRGGLALALAGFVFLLAFAVPATQLLIWAVGYLAQDLNIRYLGYVFHSLMLASTGAVLICALAVLLAYAVRNRPRPLTEFAAKLATLGYAIPGTVLAVGIFVPLATISNGINALLPFDRPVVMLQTTVVTMLFAYAIRFLAVASHPLQSQMLRITPNIDAASRNLGVAGMMMLRRVHLPILRGGLLTAMTLVFVDIMKEMPITLMTRPTGWDTLAVRVFEMTAEGHWERAALPALTIVAAGLVPVVLLVRRSEHAS